MGCHFTLRPLKLLQQEELVFLSKKAKKHLFFERKVWGSIFYIFIIKACNW